MYLYQTLILNVIHSSSTAIVYVLQADGHGMQIKIAADICRATHSSVLQPEVENLAPLSCLS